ncbi:MAG: PASTA domain-containing protein [Gemmatimonadota bacterium]
MLGDSVRRRRGGKRPPRRPGPPREGGRGARFWVSAILLALALPFGIGYLVATAVLFPPPAVADAGVPVPDLRGLSEMAARLALAEAGLEAPELSTLPHPDLEQGHVVAQAPLPGQQVLPGSVVRVAVSSGLPIAPIPDVRGFDVERAGMLLQRLGYDVERQEVESEAMAGQVMDVSPPPGTRVPVPSTIRLVVSLGPPELDPENFPWDSLPGVDTVAPPGTGGRDG